MNISEVKLKGFNNSLKYTKLKYPYCSCGNCPKFYWNLLSIASRKSGKTYNLCAIIRHYEDNKIVDDEGNQYKIRTILISPTVQANEIFHSLKSLDFDNDVYDNYSDDLLLDIIDNVKEVKKECQDYRKYEEMFKLFSKTPIDKIDKLYDSNPEIWEKLEENNFQMIEPPKYGKYPPITIIVLDDLLGTGSFSNSKKSALTNNLIKN